MSIIKSPLPLNAPYSVPLTPVVVAAADPSLVMKQADIEARILRLIEFSTLAGNLRDETEMARKMIKSKVRISFEEAHASLRRLEAKLLSQIESQLINRNIDMSLRTIEYDITQLLGKLTSMTVVDDRTHEFIMGQIDASIRNVEKNYKIAENLKKTELDHFLDGSGGRQDVSTLINEESNTITKFLDNQNMNLNSRVKFRPVSDEFKDYKEWLLKSTAATTSQKPLQKENRTGSFEFLDMEKELDLIHVAMDDFEDDDDDDVYSAQMKPQSQTEENDGVSRIFNEILNKPTEYWLLRPTNV